MFLHFTAPQKTLKVSLATALLTLSACNAYQHQDLKAEAEPAALDQNSDWVQIPAGEFQMGSLDTDKEATALEKPQHTVKVQAFKIGRHEVTFAEYERFAKATNKPLPSDSGFIQGERNRYPVINVSWHDANAYADWLSKETGQHFRLPTEAEWEYAARAGSSTERFWGDKPAQACEFANVFDQRNEKEIREKYSVPAVYAAHHHCEDAYFAIAPVGSFKANAWGLHDMLGNVWEWVQDCQHQNYIGAPTSADQAWQTSNAGDCTKHVVRGGSWFVSPQSVRVAFRSGNHSDDRGSGLGFRLVQD